MTVSLVPPADFWIPLHRHTGAVTEVRAQRGFGSDVSVLIASAEGPFFVKAMRNVPGGRRDSIVRERLINPGVVPLAPVLRWHVETAEWYVLGFEAVEARAADFGPLSRDLPRVVELIDRIGALPLPGVARDWPETRWDRFAPPESPAAAFRGDTLLHTDINAHNLLLGDGRSWIVDWSWPTHGAAFVDHACLVHQLIAAGHAPGAAEAAVAGSAGWGRADAGAVDAFVLATFRLHHWQAHRRRDEPWLAAMAEAAWGWARSRGLSP